MTLVSAFGQAFGTNGLEAGAQAANQALQGIGRAPAALGLVFASYEYPLDSVVEGVSQTLGDLPLWGFSTSGVLTAAGLSRRSVVVALLSSSDLHAQADWWPGFGEDTRACTDKMLQALKPAAHPGSLLLLAADGVNGDADLMCRMLASQGTALAGCLAGGNIYQGRTFQVGGRHSGPQGLAAALLSGELAWGMGASHGWQPVGITTRLSRSQGVWIRELDGERPNVAFARLFGFAEREWAFPPLSELVRLYPFSFDAGRGMQIRTPLRMEADGSLRMNSPAPQGVAASLLVADRDHCLQAVRQAVHQALTELQGARPVLGVLLVDAAWQSLFAAQPGAEAIEAHHELERQLGAAVPLVGGYTYGQMWTAQENTPALLNQHFLVLLIAEK